MRQIYRVAGSDLDPSSLEVDHRAQPVGAPAVRRRQHLSGRARSRDPHRPEHLRPARTGSSPGAGIPGPTRSSASRTSCSRTSQPFADPTGSRRRSAPIRSTRRRSTSCSARAARQVPVPAPLQLDRRRRPIHPQPERAADPRGQRTAVAAAAGCWSGASTTRSTTRPARSPSSTRRALRRRLGAGHGALRGAGYLRRGADHDLRPHHALLARPARRGQPASASTSARRRRSTGRRSASRPRPTSSPASTPSCTSGPRASPASSTGSRRPGPPRRPGSTSTPSSRFTAPRPEPDAGRRTSRSSRPMSGTRCRSAEPAWEFGSMPQTHRRARPSLGFGGAFDTADAVQMIWQNLVPDAAGRRGRAPAAGHRHH